MAGTIIVNFNAIVEFSPYKDTIAPGQKVITQTTIGRGGSVQSIGTSEEVVAEGDVATEGYVFLHNLDATNFVTWGPEFGGAMVEIGKLKPGEFAWFRLKPSTILRAKADTAAVKLDVRIYED